MIDIDGDLEEPAGGLPGRLPGIPGRLVGCKFLKSNIGETSLGGGMIDSWGSMGMWSLRGPP